MRSHRPLGGSLAVMLRGAGRLCVMIALLLGGLVQPDAFAGDARAGRGEPSGSSPLRLKLSTIQDPGIGTEAFRMLIPIGWKLEGGILWQLERSNLATVAMRVSNPKGTETLEVFPNIPFVWTEGGIPFQPVGAIYLGNEVLPVIDEPDAFVERVVIPRFRQPVHARIVAREALPDVARTVAASVQEPGVQKRVTAGRTRLEYQEAGKWMQEDVYCILVAAQAVILPGTTFWGTERLYSFKAEKGKLEQATPVLQAVGSSFKLNLSWFNQYQQVLQMWRQNVMKSIRAAGALSKYLAQTSEEISAMNRQAYENRQASQDRINREFSEYIRGVETYQNPFEGKSVELPSGYNEAWVNPLGEYVLSNDPNFNPNVGDTRNWRRMDAAH